MVVVSSSKEPPGNNRTIHDFFRAATSNNNNSNRTAAAATATTSTTMTTTRAAAANAKTMIATSTNNNSTDWQAKFQKLEQLLQDKDQQLKAVTNNKTILHTALQAALEKTKQELNQLQESQLVKTTKTTTVLEELLRWKSSQRGKELREKLAADGARLGRILVQKVGLRAVESWEEGYATKDLLTRKAQQKERLKVLQTRQASVETPTTTTPSSSNDGLLNLEQKESVLRHLHDCQVALKELAQEEQALNDEKGAHIRALKRVASEDASHFRSTPKVRFQYKNGRGGFDTHDSHYSS